MTNRIVMLPATGSWIATTKDRYFSPCLKSAIPITFYMEINITLCSVTIRWRVVDWQCLRHVFFSVCVFVFLSSDQRILGKLFLGSQFFEYFLLFLPCLLISLWVFWYLLRFAKYVKRTNGFFRRRKGCSHEDSPWSNWRENETNQH